jgi:hypothetical protein
LERRSLGELQPHPEPDENEHGTRDERYSPAPREELVLREELREHHEHARRQQEAEWRAELRKHAVPALLAAGSVLGSEQHRATPFAAQS